MNIITKEIYIRHEGNLYKVCYNSQGLPRDIQVRDEKGDWIPADGKLVTPVEYYGEVIGEKQLGEQSYEVNANPSGVKTGKERVSLHKIAAELGLDKIKTREELNALLKDKAKISEVVRKMKEAVGQ
jgi:hypothetical protein